MPRHSLYDLEGARVGGHEIDMYPDAILVPVLRYDGMWGKRTFIRNGGRYQQVAPTEWREPPARYTAEDNIRIISGEGDHDA